MRGNGGGDLKAAKVREMAKQRHSTFLGSGFRQRGRKGEGDRCVVAAGTPANRNELGTVRLLRTTIFFLLATSTSRHFVFFFPNTQSLYFYPFYSCLLSSGFRSLLSFSPSSSSSSLSRSHVSLRPSVRGSARPAFVLGLPNIWLLVIAPR